MKKTLVNSLHIGLLIIAPAGAFFFLCNLNNQHPLDPIPVTGLLCLAFGFGPMILALIQNTAHKLSISVLNLVVLGYMGSGWQVTLSEAINNERLGFYLFWCSPVAALVALWLWQCFDGQRPKKIT